MNIFFQKDKITSFIKKIELWTKNCQDDNFDMFSNLKNNCCIEKIKEHKALFIEHLQNLKQHFNHYFQDVGENAKHEWIRNPFIVEYNDNFELTINEQEKLIELSCDSTLKDQFNPNNPGKFWLEVSKQYSALSSKAIKILLPFVTSYMCETGFSTLAVIKTKYRARLIVENEIRVALSSYKPRFSELCEKKQAHTSH